MSDLDVQPRVSTEWREVTVDGVVVPVTPRRRSRRFWLVLGLTAATLLLLAFLLPTTFADASGGCGGG